jgi:hypothetical protein
LTDESVLPEVSSVCSGGQRADADRMMCHRGRVESPQITSGSIIEDDVSGIRIVS